MIHFSQAEIQALASGPRFRDTPGERTCPACGERAVRTYMYGSERGPGRPTLISYTWCASCRRGTGSTGPMPPDLTFTDPLEYLSKEERIRMGKDTDEFFAILDGLWAEGALPQTFGRAT